MANVIAPMGTLIVVVVKLFEPATYVWFIQIWSKIFKSPGVAPHECAGLERRGEMLDTTLVKSIMAESIYITLKCV